MPTAREAVTTTGPEAPALGHRWPRWVSYLVAGVVLLVVASGGWWAWRGLRHPTAFAGFGYTAGGTVATGTTVTYRLTSSPWSSDHGTLHVRSITPASVDSLPRGASVTVWRCSRTRVGAAGGPNIGKGPITRVCDDAEQVVGPFDYNASPDSTDALLLALQSPTPGAVRFTGVAIDYREGIRSGRQVIGVNGDVRFRRR